MKVAVAFLLCCSLMPAQEPAAGDVEEGSGRQYRTDDQKRVFGIIPNFATTSVDAKDIRPLTGRQKIRLAARDSFDPGAFFTTGLITGMNHYGKQYHPDIPLGAKGFAWRYGLNFVDNAGATMLAEGLIPALVHQDPRYFRMGRGGVLRRTAYLLSRPAVARSDEGRWTVNAGSLAGNVAMAGLGNLYYPEDQRTWSNTLIRVGINFGSQMVWNGFREFWPDVARKFQRGARAPRVQTDSQRPAQ